MTTVAQPSSFVPTDTLSPTPTTFDPSQRVPVADLSPSSTDHTSHVEANVALVWPYSNSTGTFAVLLIDRASRGQVKVIFRNGCAREVARSKLGIGDAVKLALLGCHWKETRDVISTPGKRLDWDLEFRSRLRLQVRLQDQDSLQIEYTEPESTLANTSAAEAPSPQPRVNGIIHQKPSTINVPYLTPSKSTRKSSGGTFLDGSLDPFADDDGYIVGRGRKRTKFARNSGAWNLIDSEDEAVGTAVSAPVTHDGLETQDLTASAVVNESPGRTEGLQPSSPQQTSVEPPYATSFPHSSRQQESLNQVDDAVVPGSPKSPPEPPTDEPDEPEASPIAVLRNETTTTTDNSVFEPPHIDLSSPVSNTFDNDPPSMAMLPPKTPRKQLRLPPPDVPKSHDAQDSDRATTPRLLPLASPGLPLVSPLVQRSGVEVGYFPIFQENTSQLDATGEADAEESNITPISEGSVTSEESLVVVEEHSTMRSEQIIEDQDGHIAPESADIPATSSSDVTRQDDNLTIAGLQQASLLPDQWLSSMEASIARELSQNYQPPPIQAATMRRVQLFGPETDDLYGAPEDVIVERQEPQDARKEIDYPSSFSEEHSADTGLPESQRSHREMDGTHAPSKTTAVVLDVPVSLSAQQQLRTPLDVIEEFLQSPSEAKVPEVFTSISTSEISQSVSEEQNHVQNSHSSLDGNVDSREILARDEIQVKEWPKPVEPDLEARTRIRNEAYEILEMAEEAGVDLAADVPDPPLEEEIVITSIATKEQLTTSPSPSVTAHHDEGPSRPQLPTPDQTQIESQSASVVVEQTHSEPSDQITLLSPHLTQEGPDTIIVSRQGHGGMKAQKAQPETVRSGFEPESEAIAPPRSSQRLSARNTVMSKNISSPYFTPRRSARFSTSPSRKENIPLSSPSRVTFPTSPIQHADDLGRFEDKDARQSSSPVLETTEPLLSRENGFITPLAYYAHLSSLHEHFGEVVDIIAACPTPSAKVERAKTGPKDYHTTLHLIDHSCKSDHASTVTAQIFRPIKSALPSTKAGDAIILRNFKVQTVKGRFSLLSTDTSSWAVFKSPSGSVVPEIVVSGPPLEHGPAEAAYVLSVSRWWRANKDNIPLDDAHIIANGSNSIRQTSTGPITRSGRRVKSSPAPALKSPTQNKRRRATMTDNFGNASDEEAAEASDHDQEVRVSRRASTSPRLYNKPAPAARRRRGNMTDNFSNGRDDAQAYDDSDVDKTPPPLADQTNKRRDSTVSTAPSTSTQNPGKEFTPRRSARNKSSPSNVHELRDGTKYVDDQRRRGSSIIHELRDGATYVDE